MLYITLGICFLATLLLTPIVKKIAFSIGAVDQPAKRKVHEKSMPRAGGLAIFISFLIGLYFMGPHSTATVPIILGAVLIIMTGLLDDMYELSPKLKLAGQLAAASAIVLFGDIQVHFINLPFNGRLELGWLSIPLTILWILAITNAINLIDGLDGLAAGVSSIVLVTITVMAFVMGNVFVMSIASIVLISTLAFLLFNFHPAQIFMGDTGSLFLGYIISVLSLLGFKNVTLFSLVVPVIILGVPISDTIFAIIRRLLNKKPLSAPDKSHLHHCLLRLGFSHRQTVLLIYAMSAVFGIAAILFSASTLWGGLFILALLTLAIELVVEKVGLLGRQYKPVLNALRRYQK
ncbi:Glycosyl transferase family 4 [Fictibacillus macauensis ZFHKF-1]|uniref:Glycosyl transferase family 4 n=1 Tax=Fictibacillus macauensis ZFHKF-1 TaxID=1196324 RepID=I8ALV1_9BACL|nr:MraY family glycosyltransferase [Fictibacillus macauensis]EIT86907.1 Glycosyl transferase family 4 [Fictibacillus macauensis ZFHKF-1]